MSQMIQTGIYIGNVRHRRFAPKSHSFNYQIYMMAINLDEMDKFDGFRFLGVPLTGFNKKALLAMHSKDYVNKKLDPKQLKRYFLSKISELGGNVTAEDKIVFLGQIRCLGMYFSPVNFYFCYRDGELKYTLVEVSNTPWLETHYYLLDEHLLPTQKDFHVSPFMEMAQKYHWRIKTPTDKVMIHIENHPNSNIELNNQPTPSNNKSFDATVQLSNEGISRAKVTKLLVKHPAMTLKIVSSIYWQAFKMFVFKRFAFIPHPNQRGQHGTNN